MNRTPLALSLTAALLSRRDYCPLADARRR